MMKPDLYVYVRLSKNENSYMNVVAASKYVICNEGTTHVNPFGDVVRSAANRALREGRPNS